MPKQQGQRHVQRQRDQGGGFKFGVLQHLGACGASQQVELGKLAAVHQRRNTQHADKAQRVQQAQNQHGAQLGAAGPKTTEQHGGHGELAFERLLRGHHQAQGGARQKRQSQHIAHQRHHGQERHHRHKDKEQARQRQWLAQKRANAQLDPEGAMAGRNEVEFHGAGVCAWAIRWRSMRSKGAGSWALSMAAWRGR